MTPGSFHDRFASKAPLYAASRPRYPRTLLHWIAQQAPQTRLCWDVATGSGQVAVLAANVFDRVIATDASAEQVAEARRVPGVEYRVEAAETPSLADGSVDAITVGAAAHWLHLPAFYASVRRVARPGALVALVSYGTWVADDDPLEAVLGRFVRDVLGPWWSERLAVVDNRYRDLPFPFREVPFPPTAATTQGDLSSLKDLMRTWSAAQQMALDTGADPIASIAAELEAAWRAHGPPDQPRTLRWPMFGRVGFV